MAKRCARALSSDIPTSLLAYAWLKPVTPRVDPLRPPTPPPPQPAAAVRRCRSGIAPGGNSGAQDVYTASLHRPGARMPYGWRPAHNQDAHTYSSLHKHALQHASRCACAGAVWRCTTKHQPAAVAATAAVASAVATAAAAAQFSGTLLTQ